MKLNGWLAPNADWVWVETDYHDEYQSIIRSNYHLPRREKASLESCGFLRIREGKLIESHQNEPLTMKQKNWLAKHFTKAEIATYELAQKELPAGGQSTVSNVRLAADAQPFL